MGILRNKYLKVKKGIFSVKFFIISCSYVKPTYLIRITRRRLLQSSKTTKYLFIERMEYSRNNDYPTLTNIHFRAGSLKFIMSW